MKYWNYKHIGALLTNNNKLKIINSFIEFDEYNENIDIYTKVLVREIK